MTYSNNYINLLKKTNYLSYLIFILFINSKHWIFLLFNNIYTFFNKLISFNKKQIKELNSLNFISFFKKTNLNFNRCLFLNKIIIKLIKLKNINIYLFIYNLIITLKKLFVNISTYFFNIFFKDIKVKEIFNFKNNLKIDNKNLNIDKKISFYYLNNVNNNFFTTKYYFFDNFFYNYPLSNKISLYNINNFLNSIFNINKERNNVIIKYNNITIRNVFIYIENNIKWFSYSCLNKLSLLYDFTFINNTFFMYINSIYFNILNIINKTINFSSKTSFFLKLTNYKKKDNIINISINYNLYNNILLKKEYYLKTSYKLLNQKILNYEKLSLFNTEKTSFIINNDLFYFLKKNISLIGNENWILLCNYYYNNIIYFKNIVLYLFYLTNTNQSKLTFFRYYLLYNDINFNTLINNNFFNNEYLKKDKINFLLKSKYNSFLNTESEYYIKKYIITKNNNKY